MAEVVWEMMTGAVLANPIETVWPIVISAAATLLLAWWVLRDER